MNLKEWQSKDCETKFHLKLDPELPRGVREPVRVEDEVRRPVVLPLGPVQDLALLERPVDQTHALGRREEDAHVIRPGDAEEQPPPVRLRLLTGDQLELGGLAEARGGRGYPAVDPEHGVGGVVGGHAAEEALAALALRDLLEVVEVGHLAEERARGVAVEVDDEVAGVLVGNEPGLE